MKTKLAFALRYLILAVLYFISYAAISAAVLPALQPTPSAAEASSALSAMLIISLLNTAVLAFLVVRSNWDGWKLILALCLILFGVTTVMPQIETAVFIRNLPPGFLPRMFLSGFLFSALFSLLLVLILGKIHHKEASGGSHWRHNTGPQFLLRLCLVAIIYVILYFTFGYFIAWRNPAVRQYYGGVNPGSFLAQILQLGREAPWMFFLQFIRGLLWATLALPVIAMMKGSWWEAAFAVALLFAVVMNSQLLLPNPLMPYEVRMVHLLETASSNFIFGLTLVWLLREQNGHITN